MEVETRILLTAFRNFLDRDDIKNKMITAQMPVNPKLGNLSGKLVEIPMTSVFQGLTHKLGFEEMAKVLDENNKVVHVFIEELNKQLQKHAKHIEDSTVSIEKKDEEVANISNELKDEPNEDK